MAGSPSLLPFIQEVFGIKQPFTDFVKRNKLLSFAILLNIVFFIIVFFSMEQDIRKAREVSELKHKLAEHPLVATVKPDTQCISDLVGLDAEYRRINTLYTACMLRAGHPTPNPVPRPVRDKDPVITPRSTGDDTLKRKLEAIR
jgi:hypothetical protein